MGRAARFSVSASRAVARWIAWFGVGAGRAHAGMLPHGTGRWTADPESRRLSGNGSTSPQALWRPSPFSPPV